MITITLDKTISGYKKTSCAFKDDTLYVAVGSGSRSRIFTVSTTETKEIVLPKSSDEYSYGEILLTNDGEIALRYKDSVRTVRATRGNYRYRYPTYRYDVFKDGAWKKTKCKNRAESSKVYYKNGYMVACHKSIPSGLYSAFPKALIEPYKKIKRREGLLYNYHNDTTQVFNTDDIILACSIGDCVAAFVTKTQAMFIDL
jgi:hypothetical protein